MDKEIDRDAAVEVSKQLLDAYLSVENATRIIQERCSPKEFAGFRAEAGKVAGGLYLLLEPLWRAYPEIAPEGLVMEAPKKKKRKR